MSGSWSLAVSWITSYLNSHYCTNGGYYNGIEDARVAYLGDYSRGSGFGLTVLKGKCFYMFGFRSVFSRHAMPCHALPCLAMPCHAMRIEQYSIRYHLLYSSSILYLYCIKYIVSN